MFKFMFNKIQGVKADVALFDNESTPNPLTHEFSKLGPSHLKRDLSKKTPSVKKVKQASAMSQQSLSKSVKVVKSTQKLHKMPLDKQMLSGERPQTNNSVQKKVMTSKKSKAEVAKKGLGYKFDPVGAPQMLKNSLDLQERLEGVNEQVERSQVWGVGGERKWSDPIRNQRKGKFDPLERNMLRQGIEQFLRSNGLRMSELERLLDGSKQEKGLLRQSKFYQYLGSVLPRRSAYSCYRFVMRQFRVQNRQGKWTQEEQDQLLSLVDRYGRRWKLIAERMGRTNDNVRDKYRSMGQEHHSSQSDFWRFNDLITLLQQLQRHSDRPLLRPGIELETARGSEHDQAELTERRSHSYNSKKFTFHHLSVLCKYLRPVNIKSIDLSRVRWGQVSEAVASKTVQQCRNKVVQLLEVLFRDNRLLDEQLIEYGLRHCDETGSAVDWSQWDSPEFTQEEACNRLMILKKTVEGRMKKSMREVMNALRARVHVKGDDDEK